MSGPRRIHRPSARRVAGSLAGATLVAAVLGAQTNDEVNAGLQLDLSPPGARSLAMGNAFTGLADDATAAFANPAGLLRLTRPEVSIELRARRDVQRIPDLGSVSGTPRGLGLDVLDEPTFAESDATNVGAAFLSVVAVPGERWRLAGYRHELARFDTVLESRGPFLRSGPQRTRLAAVRARLELDVVATGLSAAWAATPRLWLGLGLSVVDLQLDAQTRRYLTIDPTSSVGLAIFDDVPRTSSNERDRHLQRGDDQAFAGTLGGLWTTRGNRLSVGFVWRQAPRFDLDYSFQWGEGTVRRAAGDTDGDGVLDAPANLDHVDPGIVRALSGRTEMELPDVASLGFALRPTAALTVALQVDRVGWSNLRPEANILLNGIVRPSVCGDFAPDGTPQEPVPCEVSAERLARFRVDDTTEVHLGLEWLLPTSRWPLAFRAGAWHEPDHRMIYDTGGDPPVPPEDRFVARFRPGDDIVHWTAGVGIGGARFQVDLAADVSDRGEIVSLSSVYRF